MVRFYLDEVSPPKRSRQRPYPKNRDINPDAYDEAKDWQEERFVREENIRHGDEEVIRQKAEENAKAAEELNRRKNVVMSHLSSIANSTPFTGNDYIDAGNQQREEKIDKWHELKNGLNATMTAAEIMAAGYGITRGLTHFNRMLARRATQSTGRPVSRQATRNLLNWNKRVTRVDKPQVLMNGIGGIADAYQWFNSDNAFDSWENGIETGANVAGVVGGKNWFRDLPYLRRIGGDKIDNVLDGLGYGAAIWDAIKYLPPLSTVLDNFRNQSKQNIKNNSYE